jgi:hypothetical protein
MLNTLWRSAVILQVLLLQLWSTSQIMGVIYVAAGQLTDDMSVMF